LTKLDYHISLHSHYNTKVTEMQSESNKQNLKSLELIQNQLKHGDLQAIADKIGMSRQVVTWHLMGRAQNPNVKIINGALAYLKRKNRRFEKLENQIIKSIN